MLSHKRLKKDHFQVLSWKTAVNNYITVEKLKSRVQENDDGQDTPVSVPPPCTRVPGGCAGLLAATSPWRLNPSIEIDSHVTESPGKTSACTIPGMRIHRGTDTVLPTSFSEVEILVFRAFNGIPFGYSLHVVFQNKT